MPRAIWTGTISFGLVNVPVRLITAVKDKSVRLHMLNPEGDCRLRRKLYCPDTGEEYDFSETARGYEVAPGQYVLIEQDEIDRIKPETGDTIEIEDFVDLHDIDPAYYDRTYYLTPDEGGAKAYRLLYEAMEAAGRVGIATFVMRQHSYLAALRPRDGAILLETMHYADEVVGVEDLDTLPADAEVSDKELKVAQQLIDALAADFEPDKYRDEYREKLIELIETKAEGGDVAEVAGIEEHEAPRSINLMDALEQSLDRVKKKSA